MRLLINTLSIIMTVFALLACDDVLREEPKDFISPSTFYQTQEDAQKAIDGAYASSFFDDAYINLQRHHAEYTIARGSFTSVGNYNQPINADQFGRIDWAWEKFYRTINRANVVLARVPEIENIEENIRARILAEAYFLRAWTYWDLLKGWGPVPIRKEEFTGSSVVEAPRATKEQVYDLILSDLSVAERDLPETVGSETGKASKWAAKMLLAQVYLDMENWSAAAEKANEVIESGQYSLVSVQEADDFSKIFHNTTSSEDIMSHHASVNRSYNHLNWYHGSNTPYNTGTVWGFTMLVDYEVPLIQNWDDNDLRKGFNMYDRYVHTGTGELVETSEQDKWRFKKFIKDDNGNAVYSVPIFRLPQAYLIYAEAANMAEGGPSALALERLNVIRRRGYGYDPHTVSPVDLPGGMSQDEFRDRVILERAYELFFEDGLRWWDLRRTNQAKEVFEAAGKPFTNDRLLYPIPQQEIDNNPAISQDDQNPGY